MKKSTHNLETHLENQARNADQFVNFFWHVIRSAFILKTLKKYNKTNSVVDVGAGAGVFFKHYLTEFPKSRYYFIEPIQALRDRILKTPGSEVVTDPKAALPQEAAVVLDVLEHIENDKDFLINLHQRMASGSLLIMTCPALSLLWSDWDVKLGHFRRYNKRSLISVVESAGFKVKESRYLFHLFLLPALWRKWSPGEGAEFPMLSAGLNRLLTLWARIELSALGFLPFGTSITIIAKKD